MPVNWGNVQSQAQRSAQSHEDKKTKLIVEVGNAIDRVFDANPSDPRLEAIRIILGTTPGDTATLLNKLGIEVDTEDPDGNTVNGQRALPSPSRPQLYRLFDEDDNFEGTALPEADAINAGYRAKLDPATGEVTGYIRPRSTPASTAATPISDTEVDVKDRKGRVVNRVKVSDGISDTTLEAVPKSDGSGIDHFVVKPRFVRR